MIEDRGEYELGHGNHNNNDFHLGEEPVNLYFYSFCIEVLMFDKLDTGVLIFSMF